MQPYLANLINAVVLILLSVWGYLEAEDGSKTALIPAAFGVILLVLTPMFKKGSKVVAHIAVGLTLLLIIALFKPLTAQMGKSDTMGIIRVSIMMFTCMFAMIVFIRSFIKARQNAA